MNNDNSLKDKVKIIYLPFLVLTIGFILTYTFLHWLLFMNMGIPLKEDLVKFWLPFFLPFIPVFIWLRPRIKLLQFKNENASFGYQFLACLAIAVATIIAQEYLITSTGKLTQLDNIAQFEQVEHTRYYSLKNIYIDKGHIAVQNTATVTGKNNTDFNMLIYVAMPILKSEADTVNNQARFWLGNKYSERISNSLSDTEKNDRFKAFAESCQKSFDTTDFSQFTYLELLGNTDDHDEYSRATKKLSGANSDSNLFFEAKTEPFEARNGEKLPWFFRSLAIGWIVYFVFLLFPNFNASALDEFKSGKIKKDTDLKETFDLLIPKEGYFITPVIINLNLLIYIIMFFAGLGFVSFKGQGLIEWGANFGPLVSDGQWWRLLTSTFLHGGLMHILANMYGLIFVGIFLEPILGRGRYAVVYLVTGVLASLTSIWWHEATVSVGASGAIFGLYGFFLASLLLRVFPPDFGKSFLLSTLLFVGFNLLMGFTGGIDNAAHIGGLLSGFIIGIVLSRQLKQEVEITIEPDTNEQA